MTNEKKYQPLIAPSIKWEKEGFSDTYGECIAAPFEPGFGITFGNALRRILLGGIEGSAITSVSIEGANNEFSTIHGIKEDVLTILLRLKKLVVKNNTGEAGSLSLSVSKAGTVYAHDIKGDDHLEVLNKDLEIATLSDDAVLNMELFVSSGRGYQAAEWSSSKQSEKEEGRIYLDATFTPVLNVSFDVQKTRVGKNIDYDKLHLKITTNGAITPVESLKYAVSVLQEQLTCFVAECDVISFPVVEQQEHTQASAISQALGGGHDNVAGRALEGDAADVGNKTFNGISYEFLSKPIDVLGLPARAHNCLLKANINRVIDLVNMSEEDVVNIKNFGRKSYDDLIQTMKDFGLVFDMQVPNLDTLGDHNEASK